MTRYTVAEAAKRVKRDRRTIERWVAAGLPVHWWSNVRYIHEADLLAELRKRNLADPSKAREGGKAERKQARVRKHLQRRAKFDLPFGV